MAEEERSFLRKVRIETEIDPTGLKQMEEHLLKLKSITESVNKDYQSLAKLKLPALDAKKWGADLASHLTPELTRSLGAALKSAINDAFKDSATTLSNTLSSAIKKTLPEGFFTPPSQKGKAASPPQGTTPAYNLNTVSGLEEYMINVVALAMPAIMPAIHAEISKSAYDPGASSKATATLKSLGDTLKELKTNIHELSQSLKTFNKVVAVAPSSGSGGAESPPPSRSRRKSSSPPSAATETEAANALIPVESAFTRLVQHLTSTPALSAPPMAGYPSGFFEQYQQQVQQFVLDYFAKHTPSFLMLPSPSLHYVLGPAPPRRALGPAPSQRYGRSLPMGGFVEGTGSVNILPNVSYPIAKTLGIGSAYGKAIPDEPIAAGPAPTSPPPPPPPALPPSPLAQESFFQQLQSSWNQMLSHLSNTFQQLFGGIGHGGSGGGSGGGGVGRFGAAASGGFRRLQGYSRRLTGSLMDLLITSPLNFAKTLLKQPYQMFETKVGPPISMLGHALGNLSGMEQTGTIFANGGLAANLVHAGSQYGFSIGQTLGMGQGLAQAYDNLGVGNLPTLVNEVARSAAALGLSAQEATTIFKQSARLGVTTGTGSSLAPTQLASLIQQIAQRSHMQGRQPEIAQALNSVLGTLGSLAPIIQNPTMVAGMLSAMSQTGMAAFQGMRGAGVASQLIQGLQNPQGAMQALEMSAIQGATKQSLSPLDILYLEQQGLTAMIPGSHTTVGQAVFGALRKAFPHDKLAQAYMLYTGGAAKSLPYALDLLKTPHLLTTNLSPHALQGTSNTAVQQLQQTVSNAQFQRLQQFGGPEASLYETFLKHQTLAEAGLGGLTALGLASILGGKWFKRFFSGGGFGGGGGGGGGGGDCLPVCEPSPATSAASERNWLSSLSKIFGAGAGAAGAIALKRIMDEAGQGAGKPSAPYAPPSHKPIPGMPSSMEYFLHQFADGTTVPVVHHKTATPPTFLQTIKHLGVSAFHNIIQKHGWSLGTIAALTALSALGAVSAPADAVVAGGVGVAALLSTLFGGGTAAAASPPAGHPLAVYSAKKSQEAKQAIQDSTQAVKAMADQTKRSWDYVSQSSAHSSSTVQHDLKTVADALRQSFMAVGTDWLKVGAILAGDAGLFNGMLSTRGAPTAYGAVHIPAHQSTFAGIAPYQSLINMVSAHLGVPAGIIAGVMLNEDASGNPLANIGKKKSAYGLMQLIGSTAASMAKKLGLHSYNLFNPTTNLMLGAEYLKTLYHQFHSWRLAVAAYYGGPGTVQTALNGRDQWDPSALDFIPFPAAGNKLTLTQYVQAVMRHAAALTGATGTPPSTPPTAPASPSAPGSSVGANQSLAAQLGDFFAQALKQYAQVYSVTGGGPISPLTP